MSKFDKCYEISNKIINKYIELTYIEINAISNTYRENIIAEILYLINEEYNLIHSMTQTEVKLYLYKQPFQRSNTTSPFYLELIINY